MSGEEAVDETNAVRNIKTKAETEHAGTDDQAAIQPAEASASVRKRKSQSCRNEHHSSDGPHTKNQKIKNAPARIVDGAEDEEGNCG